MKTWKFGCVFVAHVRICEKKCDRKKKKKREGRRERQIEKEGDRKEKEEEKKLRGGEEKRGRRDSKERRHLIRSFIVCIDICIHFYVDVYKCVCARARVYCVRVCACGYVYISKKPNFHSRLSSARPAFPTSKTEFPL